MRKVDFDSDEEISVKALVYGKSGTGKTSLGVTAPKPLILLSEDQGRIHIKQAAKRLGIPAPATLLMKTVKDYRNVLKALNRPAETLKVLDDKGELVVETYWPETVVIDSLTDACALIQTTIDKESPPPIGKDGLPHRTMAAWGALGDKVRNLVRGFRGVPMNVLFLCLLDEKVVEEDDRQVRYLAPSLPMNKLKDDVCAAVNLVGYSYRTIKRGKEENAVSYGILTTGGENMTTKPYRPLRDREVTDFSNWVQRIKGELEEAPEAPAASAEMPEANQEQVKEKKEEK